MANGTGEHSTLMMMHPDRRLVFHVEPKRETCGREGHHHHREESWAIGWIGEVVIQTADLAVRSYFQERALPEEMTLTATQAPPLNPGDDRWLRGPARNLFANRLLAVDRHGSQMFYRRREPSWGHAV